MRLPPVEPDVTHAAARLRGLKVKWLGHSTFLMTTRDGTRLLFDPFITSNPSCPAAEKRVGPVDVMLISHGHDDHCADAVTIGRESRATVVASPEVCVWLGRQGLKHLRPMNIGGRQMIGGIDVAMVPAVHSSSLPDGTGLGSAAGFVVRSSGVPVIYFAGDTALFGDMRLIGERHSPEIAFLPIGDRYTMGPEEAAIAAEWLGVRLAVPMHYGTFPELTGTPGEFARYAAGRGIDALELQPGVLCG